MTTTWVDGVDALPRGTHTEFGPSAGKNLAIVTMPADYEYMRALIGPHLYDERDLEHMHEMYLERHDLVEWPCPHCAVTNLTPSAEFFAGGVSTACTACGVA